MRGGLILFILLVTSGAADAAAGQFRRPVALATAGERVLVANRRSGTVSVIDAQSLRVVDEVKVGRTLSDVAACGDAAYVTDEGAGELIRLEWGGGSLRPSERLVVAAYPVSVRVLPDGSLASVASLWSRRATIVELAGGMRVRRVVDLPFAPREQWLTRSVVVLADAFGGNLATVDVASGDLHARRAMQAHNIRGLAAASGGRELLVAHQMLDARTPTESSRVTWGQVVGNVLRAVPFDEVLPAGGSPGALGDPKPVRHWSLYALGENRRGAGDPGAIVVTPSGLTAVVLSGVNEVALRLSPLDAFTRIPVGRRPAALALSPDAKRLYVANTFDDSISVIDLAIQRVIAAISLGPQSPLGEQDLGEQLFYDARLSLDGWYSCHSCHPDGHTNGARNDNFSDGSFGTPKQIPSLLGVEPTRPWGWNGRMQTHEEQVQRSILSTMQGPSSGATADNVNALATFIRSLDAAPGVSAARRMSDPAAVARGRRAFADFRCGRCHHTPDFTSERTYDVGLPDEAGLAHFNPPSLLGVSQRERFLHDGRARTLEEVFTKFGHPDVEEAVEPKSVENLVAYLRSL